MKFYRFLGIAAVALLATLSCTKRIGGISGGEGTASFSLGECAPVADIATKSNVSDYTALPSAGAFTITVKNSDETTVYSGLISDWDTATKLTSGNYTVSATYGAEGTEGFDKPYFTGKTSFVVNGGSETAVSIPVALGNSIVKVSCTEAFANYFTTRSFKVTTGNGTEIDFPSTETRGAFIDAYKFTVSGSLTTQGGTAKTFSKTYDEVDPKTCYTVSFDVETIGGNTISISFNDETTEVTLTEVELND